MHNYYIQNNSSKPEKWRKNFPQRFHKYYLRFNPLFSLSNRLKSKIMVEVGKFPLLMKYFFAIHNSKFGTKWNLLENFTINLTKFRLQKQKQQVIAHRFVNFNIKFTCFVHVSPEICLNRKTKMCQILQIPI